MLALLRARYQAATFLPGPIGLLINPFYLAREGLWAAVSRYANGIRGVVLDVGCGTKPYRALVEADEYIGLDVGSRSGGADLLYDGSRFPLADAAFDGVICNQVLEHVHDLDAVMVEIARVLKPGGKLLITVPFVWDEHEQPHDYRRFTSFGLRELVVRHGFRVLEQEKICPDLRVVFQLINAYIVKTSAPLPKLLRILLTVTLMAFVNVMGVIAGRLLPGNPDLFLDQILLVERRA